MKQILSNVDDFDISSEILILQEILPGPPTVQHLYGEIQAGSGVKVLAGGGVYRVRVTLEDGGGNVREVFRSDVLVAAGVTKKIFDLEFLASSSNELTIYLTGLAGDVEVAIDTRVYTGVNVTEIEGSDATTVLDAIPGDVWDEVLTGATHNDPTSAGRRLRVIEDMSILAEGKARGGTATTIQLAATESDNDEAFQYAVIVLVGGTGSDPRQARHSEGYVGATQMMTIDRAWAGDSPDATTEYIIFAWPRTHVHLFDEDALAQIAPAVLGTGPVEWTYSLTETGDGPPIPDAYVRVTSDEDGLYAIAGAYTNQYGKITFNLDPGTVYLWRKKSGQIFVNPDTEVVEEE